MKTIDLKELRRIQVNILDDIDAYCRKNGTNYFIAYGTLIGAVRHKGFIPWDDDIDLAMPRPDYDKFIREYKSDKFRVVSMLNDKEYPYPYAKVEDTSTLLDENQDLKYMAGVNVDIFPLDGLPESPKEAEWHCIKIGLLRFLLRIKQIGLSKSRGFVKNAVHYMGKLLLSPVSQRCLVKKIMKMEQKYDYDKSPYVSDLNFGMSDRRMPRESFYPGIEMDFEGRKVMAPSCYDEWQRKIFGDYMQLPPVEERVSCHTFTAYYK